MKEEMENQGASEICPKPVKSSRRSIVSVVVVISLLLASLGAYYLFFYAPDMTYKEFLDGYDSNGDGSLDDESSLMHERFDPGDRVIIKDEIANILHLDDMWGGSTFILFKSVVDTPYENIPFALEGDQTNKYRVGELVEIKARMGQADGDFLPDGSGEFLSETSQGMGFFDEWAPELDWPELSEPITESNEYLAVNIEEDSTHWHLTVIGVTGNVLGNETTITLLEGNNTVPEYSEWTYQTSGDPAGNVVWLDNNANGHIDTGDKISIKKPGNPAAEYTFEIWYKEILSLAEHLIP